MYQAHEELRLSAEKKEKLERAVRYKLEIEVRRLLAQNKDLKEQNSAALATIASNHHQQQNDGGHLVTIPGQQNNNNNPGGHGQGNGSTESLVKDAAADSNVKRDLLIAQLLVNESKF